MYTKKDAQVLISLYTLKYLGVKKQVLSDLLVSVQKEKMHASLHGGQEGGEDRANGTKNKQRMVSGNNTQAFHVRDCNYSVSLIYIK